MKRYLGIFLIALAVLGITARVYCYQADVADISGNKYFPAVKEVLAKAKKSIKLVMFTIELPVNKDNSKPNQLINALIEAKKRGIEVEVILDQNVDFVQRRHSSDWEAKIKSTMAYKRLKEAGIRVYYDEPARYVHAKTIVIDNKIVILGSTNWTVSAFDNNIETDVLINSEKLAQEILAYLKTIKIDYEVAKYLESIGPATPISLEFLENPRIAALMVKEQAERAFDVYLYLLWKYDGNPQGKLTLFYDDIAKYLGIYEGWDITDYRRQVIKIFKKLEQKYKLLKFEPRYAKEATITLLNYDEGRGIYAIPDEQAPGPIGGAGIPLSADAPKPIGWFGAPPSVGYFELPEDYFKLGWNRELSLRAKFCYLINLANTDISDIKPYWSKSVNTITKEFGNIGQDVINKGMGELRREKLLEVQYDELSGKLYEQRRPKMYKLLKLYDPKGRQARLKSIEEKYGKTEYTKAKRYAEIVFEENNAEVIEDIILKTKEYGAKEIKRAFGEVARKNIDNPKRTYLYLRRILGKTQDANP